MNSLLGSLLLGSLLLQFLLAQATLGQTPCTVDSKNACKAKCGNVVLNIKDVFQYPYVDGALHVVCCDYVRRTVRSRQSCVVFGCLYHISTLCVSSIVCIALQRALRRYSFSPASGTTVTFSPCSPIKCGTGCKTDSATTVSVVACFGTIAHCRKVTVSSISSLKACLADENDCVVVSGDQVDWVLHSSSYPIQFTITYKCDGLGCT